MAIVEMKRMSLLAPKQDEKALLHAIQRLGCIHIMPADESGGFERAAAPQELSDLENRITRVNWAVKKLAKFDTTKAPMFGGKPSISTDDAKQLLNQKQSILLHTVEVLEVLEREQNENRGVMARVEAAKEQLMPWVDFGVPIREVKNTRNTVSSLATVQKSKVDALLSSGELSPLCSIEIISYIRDLANVYVVMHRSVMDEVQSQLKEMGYSSVTLNQVEGTVRQRIAELDTELSTMTLRQEAIEKETAGYVTELSELKSLYECLTSEREKLVASQDFLGSASTFYLSGWVPAEVTDKIEKRLTKVSPSICMEFVDPQEDEEPPVLLHNGKVVTPYETVVSGFSLPTYRGLDPTAAMTPFFANFMGMMISDAGYGILLVLFVPLIVKFMKPSPGAKRIMWVLFGGGIATIIWGALYNTWFGFNPWPSVFDAVGDSIPVMAVCIALGAVHLFAGLGVAAYMNIKRGKPGSAIADQLSWFMVVVGLGLMLVMPEVGKWVAIAGVAIILVTSGREKSNNPIKRLISGLGSLYGVTSWVSDLLSYMRLFGMGLATGVIGMVINQLVGMVFAGGIIGKVLGSLLFVGGHLFNMGINVLGAYVHSCRLQYIEFFGKFYEDGGKPFRPLSSTNRYCYIEDVVKPS